MRTVAYVLVAVVSFIATIVAAMGLTGSLSKEGFQRLVKGPAPPAAAAPKREDEVGPLARALTAREEDLTTREAALQSREQQVTQMEADLEQLRTEVLEIQQQVREAIQSEETDRATRLLDVATRLGKMKPVNAAKILENLPVADAAEVLRLIKDKESAKILDALQVDKASELLRALQERKF